MTDSQTSSVRDIQVDQCVFTSVKSPTGEGYRIIAASPGVRPDEKADITRRAPSHGSLCDPTAPAALGFPLASGRYCAGFICSAGKEHTARGGQRVYTHFAILDEASFRQLEFNMLLAAETLRAAVGDALILKQQSTLDRIGLSPTVFATGASAVSGSCLDSALCTSARLLAGKAVLSINGGSCIEMLRTVLVCLPAEKRKSLAWAAGLKYSPMRACDGCFVGRDQGETQRSMRGQSIEWMDWSKGSADQWQGGAYEGWFAFVRRLLASGDWQRLNFISSRMTTDAPAERMNRAAMMCDDADRAAQMDADALEKLAVRWSGVAVTSEPEKTLLSRLALVIEDRRAILEQAKQKQTPAVCSQ